jgi:endonuclease YncB( thermonuclease family)
MGTGVAGRNRVRRRIRRAGTRHSLGRFPGRLPAVHNQPFLFTFLAWAHILESFLGLYATMRIKAFPITGAFAIGVLIGTTVPAAHRSVRPSDASPRPSPSQEVARAYAAELTRVIDGDTFEARVRVWPGVDVTTRVRLRGIDAPEMNARCAAERIRAEAARDALAALLADRGLTVLNIGPDKYAGRIVADAATRRTPDVSGALLAQGVARVYTGGRRQSWCG